VVTTSGEIPDYGLGLEEAPVRFGSDVGSRPDADRELRQRNRSAVVGFHRLLHLHCGGEGVGRGWERHDQPVAPGLQHVTAVRFGPDREKVIVDPAHLIGPLLPRGDSERGRTHHPGEEHGGG